MQRLFKVRHQIVEVVINMTNQTLMSYLKPFGACHI